MRTKHRHDLRRTAPVVVWTFALARKRILDWTTDLVPRPGFEYRARGLTGS